MTNEEIIKRLEAMKENYICNWFSVDEFDKLIKDLS